MTSYLLVEDGTLFGIMGVRCPMKNLDSALRRQITWDVYSKIQASRGEEPASEDNSGRSDKGDSHAVLGAVDVSHAGKPCTICVTSTSLIMNMSQFEVLRLPLTTLAVAMSVPSLPSRLMFIGRTQQCAFKLGQDSGRIALVVQLTTTIRANNMLDFLARKKVRSQKELPLKSEASVSPISSSSATSDLVVDVRFASAVSLMEGNTSHTDSPVIPPESSLHLKVHKEDRLSGVYDQLPPGPPRRVEHISSPESVEVVTFPVHEQNLAHSEAVVSPGRKERSSPLLPKAGTHCSNGSFEYPSNSESPQIKIFVPQETNKPFTDLSLQRSDTGDGYTQDPGILINQCKSDDEDPRSNKKYANSEIFLEDRFLGSKESALQDSPPILSKHREEEEDDGTYLDMRAASPVLKEDCAELIKTPGSVYFSMCHVEHSNLDPNRLPLRDEIMDRILIEEKQHIQTIDELQTALATPGTDRELLSSVVRLYDFHRLMMKPSLEKATLQPCQQLGEVFVKYRSGFKLYKELLVIRSRFVKGMNYVPHMDDVLLLLKHLQNYKVNLTKLYQMDPEVKSLKEALDVIDSCLQSADTYALLSSIEGCHLQPDEYGTALKVDSMKVKGITRVLNKGLTVILTESIILFAEKISQGKSLRYVGKIQNNSLSLERYQDGPSLTIQGVLELPERVLPSRSYTLTASSSVEAGAWVKTLRAILQ